MATSYTEDLHAGAFLVSEAAGTLSREAVTVLSGQNLKAGAVLGRVTLGAATAAAGGGNTGNGTVTAISLAALALVGAYTLTCTAVGTAAGTAVAASGTGAAAAGNTGDGTITAAPATGAGCKAGVYRITCIEPATNAGTFQVEDPAGVVIGTAAVGVEFTTHVTFTIADGGTDFAAGDAFTVTVAAADGGVFSVRTPDGYFLPDATVGAAYTSQFINFTINDGATDFIVGDTFTVTVAAGSGKYKEWNPSNSDGSEIAAGVLWGAVDASSADKSGVAIVRTAEVHGDSLVWFSGASSGNKTTGKSQLATLGVIAR